MKARSISQIRKSFDAVDKQLVLLLHTRTELAKEIAVVKKYKKLNVLQKDIWQRQLQKRLQENKKLKNNPAFLEKIFAGIHKESLRIQKQVYKKIK